MHQWIRMYDIYIFFQIIFPSICGWRKNYFTSLIKSYVRPCYSVAGDIDVIDSDGVIGETGEQLLTISRPGKRGTGIRVGSDLVGLVLGLFDDQFSDSIISRLVKVENLDTIFTGGGNPLSAGVEANLVDGSTSVKGSQVFLQVLEVPDLNEVFTTTSGNVETIGGNSKRVDVVLVSLEGIFHDEVRLPDLQSTVPTRGGEVRIAFIGGVSDGGDPVLMVVGFVGVLTFSKGVPELVSSVSTGRDNLSVVAGETNGVDFLLVTNEGSGGLTGSKIPKSDGLVPWWGKTEEVVTREGNIGDEVVVTSKRLKGETVKLVLVSTISVIGTSESPDHNSLISGTSDQDVGIIGVLGVGGADRGNPVTVTFEVTNIVESGSFRIHNVWS